MRERQHCDLLSLTTLHSVTCLPPMINLLTPNTPSSFGSRRAATILINSVVGRNLCGCRVRVGNIANVECERKNPPSDIERERWHKEGWMGAVGRGKKREGMKSIIRLTDLAKRTGGREGQLDDRFGLSVQNTILHKTTVCYR